MGRRWKEALGVAFVLILAGCFQNLAPEPKVPRITKEELRGWLGNPGVVILDVRTDRSWEDTKEKIRGAVREDPEKDVKAWASKYPKDKILVFY